MKLTLNTAILIKRYKRFLADVTLLEDHQKNETVTTIHCANTGAMTGCADSGNKVFYSISDNPKRKYPFSWEVSQTRAKHYICVNTLRANQLVEEALNNGVITELSNVCKLQREVKYGNENSRIDFLLQHSPLPIKASEQNQKLNTYIEVKSVTLFDSALENIAGQGYFPDAVSTRGQKHLRELMDMVQEGHRAILLFAVLHTGITQVSAAQHIDKKYALLLEQAQKAGVEILAYKAKYRFEGLTVDIKLAEKIPFNFNNSNKNIDEP
jgi:sugar fermentation stimulation protein A